jgi:hypothetical protein
VDDFGNEYWHDVDWRARQDFDVMLWRVMYFYGMIYGPSVYEGAWVDLKENVL